MDKKLLRVPARREAGLRFASLILMMVAKRMLRASKSEGVKRPRAIEAPSVALARRGESHVAAMASKVNKPSKGTSAVVLGAVLGSVVISSLVIVTVRARRRGFSGIGGETIVKCREGHLFTTLWVPGASIKAVRLGMRRFQHCPVGDHWTMVEPVNDIDLTEDDRREAGEHHDVKVP